MKFNVKVKVITEYNYVIEGNNKEDVEEIATEIIEDSDDTLVDSYVDEVEITKSKEDYCNFSLEKKENEYIIKDYKNKNIIKKI